MDELCENEVYSKLLHMYVSYSHMSLSGFEQGVFEGLSKCRKGNGAARI